MDITINRKTKTSIELFKISDAWVLNCIDHDQCCEFATKSEALEFRANPDEFCSSCAMMMDAE